MAIDLIGLTVPVPGWLIAIAIIAFIAMFFVSFVLVIFGMQIPNLFAQIKAQMKRQAMVLMHYSNRRVEAHCPSREGKKKHKNTLTFPKALGTKFDASGQGLEEVWGKTVLYNYYSKASHPVPSVYAKAVQDFRDFCGSKGIPITEELIDALLVHNLDIYDVYTEPLYEAVINNLPLPIRTKQDEYLDEHEIVSRYNTIISSISRIKEQYGEDEEYTADDRFALDKLNRELVVVDERYKELEGLKIIKQELKDKIDEIDRLQREKTELVEEIDIITGYLDPETKETVYTLKRLKEDLEKLVIKDGLFVFPKVHEFAFAVSALNSAGMSEAISIAEADAHQQNLKQEGGLDMNLLFGLAIMGIILLMGGAIAYKAAFG